MRDEKRAEVYFPIEGERYYVVVYLDVEPQISVRWVGISPGNRVYFYAKSEEHPVDELIAMAGVEPTKTWEKGKRKRHHGFEVQPHARETGEVEEKLRTLINVLLPYTANIHALSALADVVGINIAYWGYQEQMGGMHFDTDIIQGLAALNLSVDIDLYAGGSLMDS